MPYVRALRNILSHRVQIALSDTGASYPLRPPSIPNAFLAGPLPMDQHRHH
jgi:hypothetical protein